MDAPTTATVERIDGPDADSGALSAMLTVQDVARMLNCSGRTVYRLIDSGRIPRPVRLGALVRWPRQVIERWIADRCPNVRKEVRAWR